MLISQIQRNSEPPEGRADQINDGLQETPHFALSSKEVRSNGGNLIEEIIDYIPSDPPTKKAEKTSKEEFKSIEQPQIPKSKGPIDPRKFQNSQSVRGTPGKKESMTMGVNPRGLSLRLIKEKSKKSINPSQPVILDSLPKQNFLDCNQNKEGDFYSSVYADSAEVDPKYQLQRFFSGEIPKNHHNRMMSKREKFRANHKLQIHSYDHGDINQKRKTPEYRAIMRIADGLLEVTKSQKNRSNVEQLLRGKSLRYTSWEQHQANLTPMKVRQAERVGKKLKEKPSNATPSIEEFKDKSQPTNQKKEFKCRNEQNRNHKAPINTKKSILKLGEVSTKFMSIDAKQL